MLNRDKAAQMLRQAADLVSGDRAKTHGECQLMLTAELWSQYLGGLTITERDVALMMALVKISRAKAGDSGHEDHYVDGAAYIAMAGAMEEEPDPIWHARPEAPTKIVWETMEEAQLRASRDIEKQKGLDPREPCPSHQWVSDDGLQMYCAKCGEAR